MRSSRNQQESGQEGAAADDDDSQNSQDIGDKVDEEERGRASVDISLQEMEMLQSMRIMDPSSAAAENNLRLCNHNPRNNATSNNVSASSFLSRSEKSSNDGNNTTAAATGDHMNNRSDKSQDSDNSTGPTSFIRRSFGSRPNSTNNNNTSPMGRGSPLIRSSSFARKNSTRAEVSRYLSDNDSSDSSHHDEFFDEESSTTSRGGLGGGYAGQQEDDEEEGVDEYTANLSDHLEWDPVEQQKQKEIWRNYQRRQKAGTSIFDQRQDLRSAPDQSINLMDASVDSYDHHPPGRRKKRNSGGMDSSLVDIILDRSMAFSERHIGGSVGGRRRGGRRRPTNYNRKRIYCPINCFSKDLCCNRFAFAGLFMIAFIAAIVGFYLRHPDVSTSSSDNPSSSNINGLLEDLKEHLIQYKISTQEEIESQGTPQYLAMDWLSSQLHGEVTQDILSQAYALLVLYYSTTSKDDDDDDDDDATTWSKATHWLTSSTSIPAFMCEWYGVDCEEKTHLVHLNLTSNNLQGNIPGELQLLSELVTCDLSQNKLEGTLPETLGNTLTALEYLWWHDNLLSGPVPSQYGAMTNLRSVQLYQNQLQGSLPSELNQWTKLQTLALQSNQLSGSIPYLEGLQEVEYLSFNDNDFSGEIPYGIFRLHSLVELRGGNNQMTGTLAPEIESIHNLRVVSLGNNKLSGEVPDIFDRLVHLTELHLQNNTFRGTVPPTFGKLSMLEKLLLDTNRFTGRIPEALQEATRLRVLRMFNNELSGSMPLCTLAPNNQLEILEADCDKISACDCCSNCN